MGYHAQLADYSAAMVEQNGYAPKMVYVVAVEQLPPHNVAVYELSANALDQGARMCRLWFETLLGCEATGHWPGYCEDSIEFDVPTADDDVDNFGLTFGGGDGDEDSTSEEAA